MSTHASIIYKTADGYAGIYCHFDGYPSHTGRVLNRHYSQPAKVAELIALGDISGFARDGLPDAYRDRGEDCPASTGATLKEVEAAIGGSFTYVFDGAAWTCNGKPLAEAIDKDDDGGDE
jgi:hypothetical protein